MAVVTVELFYAKSQDSFVSVISWVLFVPRLRNSYSHRRATGSYPRPSMHDLVFLIKVLKPLLYPNALYRSSEYELRQSAQAYRAKHCDATSITRQQIETETIHFLQKSLCYECYEWTLRFAVTVVIVQNNFLIMS